MSILFLPAVLGELALRNRIIMCPLTRNRAGPNRVPGALNAEYYGQRASAGLIVTEATSVDPMGVGYVDTPGIWSKEQVEGWKLVTRRVHSLGGIILLQLWHAGRMSHPIFLDGKTPVAPSAIPAQGHLNPLGPIREFVVPRALESKEIPEIIQAYKRGAENAERAGFDGVEIHAANGYLPEQFLQSDSNRRTDHYGGSLENRARFLLEVVESVMKVWGPGRVGVHIAPRGDSNIMRYSNPKRTFGHLASELGKRKIAFLFVREFVGDDSIGPYLKEKFKGHFIANDGMNKGLGEQLLKSGKADSIAFGRLFIANPDLVERFTFNAKLNLPDATTYYTSGPKGYTDYPFLKKR